MSYLLLTAANKQLEQRLRSGLDAVNGTFQAVPPAELFAQLEREVPDVLILGPEVETSQTLAVAARVDGQFPWVSIVLVAESAPELWPDAMRAGVREIVAPDAEPDEVRLAIARARQITADRRHAAVPAGVPDLASGPETGRIIAIISPKGGVGKTTVASNLAVGLARLAPLDTVLVDLDVQFGDIASAMQLIPDRTLTDAVQAAAANDSLVLKSYLTTHPSGCYVVCGPPTPVEGDRVTGEEVGALLQQLASEFRYVIADTAPGLGEQALAAIEHATDAVIVCGMDVPSLRGLRTELAVLAELDMIPGTRHVVLNFADRRGGLSVRDAEASIGMPVDLVLPKSSAVTLSTNRGIPLLQDKSRDPVAKGLQKLVRRFDAAYTGKGRRWTHRRAVLK